MLSLTVGARIGIILIQNAREMARTMRAVFLKIRRFGLISLVVVVLAVGYRTEIRREKYSRARSDISNLETRLKHFWMDNGSYPTTDQGLLLLFNMTDIDPGIGRGAPKLELPLDPWGNPYFYQSDGASYILGSFGPGQNNAPDASLFVRSK